MIRPLFTVAVLALGVAAPAAANGRMEDTRQSFYHEVTDAYKDTVKYLEANNTNEGAVAVKKLHELMSRLLESMSYLEKSAREMSPVLEEIWRPVMSAAGAFNTQAAQLELLVGEKEFKDNLRVLKDTYERTGTEWERAYEKMKAFGQKFNQMCDTCR